MNSKMCDARRISFDLPLIGDVKSSGHSIKESVTKSFRYEITVDLFEPDMETFPEFNYKKLLHMEKKKQKKIQKPVNGVLDDPFEDNNADVERIAKEFERKYGGTGGYNSSKKIKRSNLDCCDKGVGYDDNDSFIDNTEAYDEIIPEEIETVNGGFYINSGSLEFKNISNFERPEDAIRMPKPKKRVISSSSSSDSSDGEDDDDATMENDELNNEIVSKNKNGHPTKKQKIIPSNVIIEQPKIIKENKIIVKEKIEIKKIKKDKNEDASSENELNNGKDKPIKTTTVKDMLRAKRDSCLLMKEGAVKGDSLTNTTDKEINEMDPESTSSSFTSISSHERPKTPGTTIDDISATNNNIDSSIETKRNILLPVNLPDELLKNINFLKEAGINAKTTTGKINFFDSRVSELLLKIDNEARMCGSTSRNQLYSYLECFLPCTKQTLLSRSKKLRLKQDEVKLNKACSNLKKEVDELAPSVLKSYTEECAKVTHIRSKMTIDEKLNNLPKMPRRRFPWNETIRNHFYEIYQIKSSFFNSAKAEESLDEFLEMYFKQDIVKIWPEGWMKVEELKKEIRRLTGQKKPKENKKPTDIVTITLEKEPQNIASSAVQDSSKLILSSNNAGSKSTEKSVSMIQQLSTKTDKSSHKNSSVKSENSNASSSTSAIIGSQINFGNNLTITAVKSATVTSNPSNKNQSTINKIDITTIPSNSSNLPNNTSSSKSSTKDPKNLLTSNKTVLPPTAPKLPSSLSISITTSPTNSSHTHHKETSSSGSVTSTSRRPSDYSINSIMSTATTRSISPGATNYPASAGNLSNQSKSTESMHSKLPETTIETIKKNKSDTITSLNTQSGNKKDIGLNLNVRSVTKINSMVDNHDDDEASSDSSDGVEIVGVFPINKKSSSTDIKSVKPKEMNITAQQYKNKHENYNQKSSSTQVKTDNSNSSHGQSIKASSSSKTENLSSAVQFMNPNDNDLDVMQIMKDLKVLQEMQKTKN